MMPEILETIMLICFGLSWPLNVYKNIKARTAKSMSLPFILLIIVGYAAGITAKILTRRINYVLAVYIVNLVIVSINVFIYFINRRYDRAAEAAETSGGIEDVRVFQKIGRVPADQQLHQV